MHARVLSTGIALLLSPVACGGAFGGGGASNNDDAANVLVGNPAPNFTARAVGSKETVTLKRWRGQVVLVDFWGTFCEPCKKSFPKLEALQAKYADRGFRVVGISEDEADDKDKIVDFAKTYGAKFLLAWDEDKSIARSYRPETMPSTFLIDRQGIVRYAHVGFHDGEEVELDGEVQGLLAK
ncbi:MAG TPA: TlpA disulfide reductase family protein [Polyangiaceae bacterium]|jgi:peroxiredoxin